MDEPIQRLGRCPCYVYTESLDDTVIAPAIAFNLILQAKKAAFLPPRPPTRHKYNKSKHKESLEVFCRLAKGVIARFELIVLSVEFA
ncbi:hypothetical protein QQF64_032045 [Cirrhinus molitorella]|uniref:Uncharacterized protein n=1 Tax=Cirrhinus molitorella TaxID=172907 RepID=A0ABR3MYN1_9TELE